MHVPGTSVPQPWPSQVPELHSAPLRQLAPSAFEAVGAVSPPVPDSGGVAGGMPVVSWVAPGSFVVGGVSVGSGAVDGRMVGPEQPASTSAISKILIGMRASYTPRDG